MGQWPELPNVMVKPSLDAAQTFVPGPSPQQFTDIVTQIFIEYLNQVH